MFFIFGTRQIKRSEGKSAIYDCPHCHNTNRFELMTIRSWLSLYFIPLIPFKTVHLEYCPICNLSRELSAEALAKIKADANADIAYLTSPGHPTTEPGPASEPVAPTE